MLVSPKRSSPPYYAKHLLLTAKGTIHIPKENGAIIRFFFLSFGESSFYSMFICMFAVFFTHFCAYTYYQKKKSVLAKKMCQHNDRAKIELRWIETIVHAEIYYHSLKCARSPVGEWKMSQIFRQFSGQCSIYIYMVVCACYLLVNCFFA